MRVPLLSHMGGTRGSRVGFEHSERGMGSWDWSGAERWDSDRARVTRECPQSPTVPGTGPSLFHKVEPFPSKPVGFQKERGGRSQRRARLGGLCIYQRSPGLGKCLRWGHVVISRGIGRDRCSPAGRSPHQLPRPERWERPRI